MGAIASGSVRVLNEDVVSEYRIPDAAIDEVARTEQAELERRERAYRDGRTPVDLRDRIVILVDDGLATGSTMKAADRFATVGHWYRDFSQTTDEEVRALLHGAPQTISRA